MNNNQQNQQNQQSQQSQQSQGVGGEVDWKASTTQKHTLGFCGCLELNSQAAIANKETDMMMDLTQPQCSKRNCKHFLGATEFGTPDNPNMTPVCKAFPAGIPKTIGYGTNLHLKPFKGDNGIQFEEGNKADALT